MQVPARTRTESNIKVVAMKFLCGGFKDYLLKNKSNLNIFKVKIFM